MIVKSMKFGGKKEQIVAKKIRLKCDLIRARVGFGVRVRVRVMVKVRVKQKDMGQG